MRIRAGVNQGARKTILTFWGLSVLVALLTFWRFHGALSMADFETWVSDHRVLASLIYVLVLSLRGVFLLPSTPLIFAGVVVFPPAWVWGLNMVGIVTSSTLVYSLVHWVGLDYMVRARYRRRVAQLRRLMERYGVPVIVGWSLFPLVPTDVIVYTASTVRLRLWKCLAGVLLGEGLLNALYVQTGQGLVFLLAAGG